jgi:hypothetical protein
MKFILYIPLSGMKNKYFMSSGSHERNMIIFVPQDEILEFIYDFPV